MSNHTTVNTTAPSPPQLPKINEVSTEVALKYLDIYQEYIATYRQSRELDNKKNETLVPPSRDSSVAPSMSASQTGPPIPAIVRTNADSSILSFTPPCAPGTYSGLVVDCDTETPGFCYLALVKDTSRSEIRERLGRYPTFREIMMIDREHFLDDDRLSLLQIARTRPEHYHVLTGSIMPNALSTLAAIAESMHLDVNDNSLYSWVHGVVPRQGLSSVPSPDDVLGSDYTYRSRRRYDNRESDAIYTTRYSQYSYPDGSIQTDQIHTYTPNIIYREPRVNEQQSSRRSPRRTSSSSGYYGNYYGNYYGHYGTYYDPYGVARDRRDNDARHNTHSSSRSRNNSNSVMYRAPNNSDDIQYISPRIIEYDDALAEMELLSLQDSDRSPSSRNTSSRSILSSNTSTSSIKVFGSLQGLECTICKEVINDGAGFLSCGHVYHAECVDPWLETNHTCPTCRQEV